MILQVGIPAQKEKVSENIHAAGEGAEIVFDCDIWGCQLERNFNPKIN